MKKSSRSCRVPHIIVGMFPGIFFVVVAVVLVHVLDIVFSIWNWQIDVSGILVLT